MSGIENPDFTFDDWEACFVSAEARTSLLGVQAVGRVQLLVNKMMMDNYVNLVGEGYDFSSCCFCCFLCFILREISC